MGIDIYMSWSGQTEAEKEAQCTRCSIVHGHVGYLREAYHGPPYATRELVPEAFDRDKRGESGAPIAAARMLERLPRVLELAGERHRRLYPGDGIVTMIDSVRAFADFVGLAETKERETGEPVRVYASY